MQRNGLTQLLSLLSLQHSELVVFARQEDAVRSIKVLEERLIPVLFIVLTTLLRLVRLLNSLIILKQVN
jgi:hypothetical protein